MQPDSVGAACEAADGGQHTEVGGITGREGEDACAEAARGSPRLLGKPLRVGARLPAGLSGHSAGHLGATVRPKVVGRGALHGTKSKRYATLVNDPEQEQEESRPDEAEEGEARSASPVGPEEGAAAELEERRPAALPEAATAIAALAAVPAAGVCGLLAVAASAVCFSMMGVGVLLVAETFSATQTMFARSVVQTSLSLGYLTANGLPWWGPPGVRRWVVLRGFVGCWGQWILLFAVTQIPLGDANAILFVNPIFTAILSCVLLGEPLLLMEGAALALSIVGVTLVARPPMLFGSAGGREEVLQGRAPRQLVVLLCMFGAMTIGSIFIIVRRIGKAAHWMSLVMSTAFIGGVLAYLALIMGVQARRWPLPAEVGWQPYLNLLGIGLLGSLGQSLFNFGMQLERRPSLAAITRQLDVPFAFLWQVAIFGEVPTGFSLFGSLLVLASTTMVLARKLLCGSGSSKGATKQVPK